jgi:hypothetical protein
MSVNVCISESEPAANSDTAVSLPRSLIAHRRIGWLDSHIKHAFIVLGVLLAMSVNGFLVTGYHPGAEDDSVYLTAVKADLNPTLFPHDADFFQLQLKTTVFDTWMAAFVRGTGTPLAWALGVTQIRP